MKSIYNLLQPVWHYFKCVILLRQEIGRQEKKKFKSFGSKSIINKPYMQISGLNKISIGNLTTILKGCRLSVYGESDTASILIGDNCYISYNFTALSYAQNTIKIGNDVLFASNVLITSENHGINPEVSQPYMDQQLSGSDVFIGDGCWIGEKVCILSGVSIGEKSVIGAGSVVTKSIPSYSIAVGNPAKVIKKYNFESHSWEGV